MHHIVAAGTASEVRHCILKHFLSVHWLLSFNSLYPITLAVSECAFLLMAVKAWLVSTYYAKLKVKAPGDSADLVNTSSELECSRPTSTSKTQSLQGFWSACTIHLWRSGGGGKDWQPFLSGPNHTSDDKSVGCCWVAKILQVKPGINTSLRKVANSWQGQPICSHAPTNLWKNKSALVQWRPEKSVNFLWGRVGQRQFACNQVLQW